MHGRESQDRPRAPWRGLLVLNVLLLAALAAVTWGGAADAQGRSRGDFVMVAGHSNGAQGGVVYVVDTVNQELIAVTYDHNAKDIAGIGYRNLAADAASVGATRPR